MSIIEQIKSPSDLKNLTVDELSVYAEEIRRKIISTVNIRGGHLASNLGCVELTIALHYVFNCPDDKILFDTGHQAYAHKIITGRYSDFDNLRKDGGISGFERKSESVYDAYSGGHSGNSLSVGLGILRAHRQNGEKSRVVSVIGDGALTAGVAYEALNDIGAGKDNLIIVLNDNKMSISKNVGAISGYLGRLRMSARYADFKEIVKKFCLAIPFIGDKLFSFADNTKDGLKSLIIGNSFFESIGIKYYGPFDGHDIKTLIGVFNAAKEQNRPVILHVLTDKGRGYKYAEDNPRAFHGVSPSPKIKGHSFASVFGKKICEMAERNGNIAAITAAMTDGVGLNEFSERFGERFYDVGIAEQHAVDLAAGLANGGMKPYFAVYSSFIQRALDQVITDVCIDNLPVAFIIDHAGFVDGDGITHQGIFDLSVLLPIPNLAVCSPMDGEHLEKIMEFTEKAEFPVAVRFPKSFRRQIENIDKSVSYSGWNIVRNDKNDILIIVHDAEMLSICLDTAGADIVFATFLKPMDGVFLSGCNGKYKAAVVVENNLIKGGLGESVVSYFNDNDIDIPVTSLGYTSFVDCYDMENCCKENGLTCENLNKIIINLKNG